MVKLFPVRSVKSTTEEEMAPLSSPSNKIPNRFRSKIYDRSVFSGDDCVKAFGGICKCFLCSPYPVVVVSAGESICDQYNITCRNIKEFLDGGLLEPLVEESFVIYGQETSCDGEGGGGGGMQIGILAALDIEDCCNNIVKKHELCIPADTDNPISTKQKQYQSLYVDPIMIMYRQNEIIDEIVTKIISEEESIPILNKLHNGNGQFGRHHLWAVKDRSDIIALQTAFEMVESLYIADGHHRTAAACKMMCSPRPQRKGISSPSSRFITALIFPDTQLNVLSFNRCVKSFANLQDLQFLEAVSEKFRIVKLDDISSSTSTSAYSSLVVESLTSSEDVSDQSGSSVGSLSDGSKSRSSTFAEPFAEDVEEIQMYYAGEWYQLFAFDNTYNDVDAQILVDNLFSPILKMTYPESEKNMIYVDGRQGRKGIEDCVNEGKAIVGFCVRRVSTRAIMNIADEGKLLPPKATFFDPKPLSGLLLRLKR